LADKGIFLSLVASGKSRFIIEIKLILPSLPESINLLFAAQKQFLEPPLFFAYKSNRLRSWLLLFFWICILQKTIPDRCTLFVFYSLLIIA